MAFRSTSRDEIQQGRPPGRSPYAAATHTGGGYHLNDYTNASWWGGNPLYHFRDWRGAPFFGNKNFVNSEGREAKIGDRIYQWTNPINFGNAIATKDFDFVTDGSAYTTQPVLVEKTYSNGKTFKGLNFTGQEFLQVNATKLPFWDGLITTSGTDIIGAPFDRTGASFLFIIDPHPDVTYSPEVPPIAYSVGWDEYLIYSHNPAANLNAQQFSIIPKADLIAPWPRSTPNGVTFSPWSVPGRRMGAPWTSVGSWETNVQYIQRGTYGPQGWWTGFVTYAPEWAQNDDIGTYESTDNWIGGSYKGWLRTVADGPSGQDTYKDGYGKRDGLQALLLVYDGKDDLVKNEMPAGSQVVPGPPEFAGVKLYAMSADNDYGPSSANYTLAKDYITKPLAWSVSRNLPSQIPAPIDVDRGGAMVNQDLIKVVDALDTYWFLGGIPPINEGLYGQQNPIHSWMMGTWGHGFRGILYECAVYECVLSDDDRSRLFTQIGEKYGEGAIY